MVPTSKSNRKTNVVVLWCLMLFFDVSNLFFWQGWRSNIKDTTTTTFIREQNNNSKQHTATATANISKNNNNNNYINGNSKHQQQQQKWRCDGDEQNPKKNGWQQTWYFLTKKKKRWRCDENVMEMRWRLTRVMEMKRDEDEAPKKAAMETREREYSCDLKLGFFFLLLRSWEREK